MPELSIIIPVADESQATEQSFEDLLVSVLENRPDDCEIIVVRDERYGDPYALGDEVTFVEARREAGLVERFTVGIGASRAELVHLLSGATRVTTDWTTAALSHFRRPRVAAVVPVLFDHRRPERTVAAGVALTAGGGRRLRRRLPRHTTNAHETDLAAPLVAAFFRKSAYQLVGGLDVTVGDVLADVDLSARLRHAGYISVIEPDTRLTHDGPVTNAGEVDARYEERLFWRNVPTFGWTRALRKHPLAVAWRLLRRPLPWHVAQALTGRAAALTEIRQLREHYRKLAGIQGLANVMGEPETEGLDAGTIEVVDQFDKPAVLTIESHRPSNRRTASRTPRRSRAA